MTSPARRRGEGIPYGVYDVAHNDGFVVVGTSHDTPCFAVSCIRRWWLKIGRERYPGVPRLLIEADGGGSNDCRKWGWKVGAAGSGERVRPCDNRDSLPAGSEQVEPDRPPYVQPDQRQLEGESR